MPLVRLMLRYGMAYGDFAALAKRAFVQVAQEDFAISEGQRSVARVSVLTGINRKDVKRLLDTTETVPAMEYNRAARVISGWLRDSNFHDDSGSPKPLVLNNSETSFGALVRKYSGDMPPRTVLDELLRVGAVERKDKTVFLGANGYVPENESDEMLDLAGASVADLLSTVDHNLDKDTNSTRLQLSVAYDDVPLQGVEMFRTFSNDKAVELLNTLDSFLSSKDRSINPDVEGQGQYRTGIGIYYFEEKKDD